MSSEDKTLLAIKLRTNHQVVDFVKILLFIAAFGMAVTACQLIRCDKGFVECLRPGSWR